MNEQNFWPVEDDVTDALFSLLGVEERVLLHIAPDGHIIWQSRAAEALLGLTTMAHIGEALSGPAENAVKRAAREGGFLDMEEELAGSPWRLRARPAPGGLMLLAEPCAPRTGERSMDFVRSQQIQRATSSLLALAELGVLQADDSQSQERWQRVGKQTRKLWRACLHGEILDGGDPLDSRLIRTDLTLLCRQLGEAVSTAAAIPVEVRADVITAVASVEEVQCIVLNLLTNAAAQEPQQIVLELRRKPGHIRITVSHDGAPFPADRLDEALGGWEGMAADRRPEDLARLGLGLPVVQKLLGRRGGSLLAETDSRQTRFIALFPDDLPEDPPQVRQRRAVTGIDLLSLELSALQ